MIHQIVCQKTDTKSSFENELLQLEAKKLSALLEPQQPEDEDLLFFKSLISYMKQLNPLQKLQFRSTIQDTLLRELSTHQFSYSSNTMVEYPNPASTSSTSDSNNTDYTNPPPSNSIINSANYMDISNTQIHPYN